MPPTNTLETFITLTTNDTTTAAVVANGGWWLATFERIFNVGSLLPLFIWGFLPSDEECSNNEVLAATSVAKSHTILSKDRLGGPAPSSANSGSAMDP